MSNNKPLFSVILPVLHLSHHSGPPSTVTQGRLTVRKGTKWCKTDVKGAGKGRTNSETGGQHRAVGQQYPWYTRLIPTFLIKRGETGTYGCLPNSETGEGKGLSSQHDSLSDTGRLGGSLRLMIPLLPLRYTRVYIPRCDNLTYTQVVYTQV